MNRREFITLLGGAAAAWPLAASAQQGERMRRIGVLMINPESDPEGQTWVRVFREEIQKLGWTEGRNIRMDIRWATPGDVEAMSRLAKEFVSHQPDLILSQGTPSTVALLKETRTIPIVFAIAADPIGSGFVAKLPATGWQCDRIYRYRANDIRQMGRTTQGGRTTGRQGCDSVQPDNGDVF